MTMHLATPSARVAIAALLLGLPVAAHAQADSAAPRRWELRITSGSLLPTGEQRRQLARGPLTTVQLSWLPRPSLAITGTAGWATSRDLASAGSPRLNAFTVDLGAEARPARWVVGRRVSLSPFAGLGAGTRSYDYRARRSEATHNVAGFGALGAELGVGRIGVRLEARQYVGGFAPMDGAGPGAVRSDLMLLTSLRFNRRAPARR